MIRTGRELGMPLRKANTIKTELKRRVPKAVARNLIKTGKLPCMKEWSPVTVEIKTSLSQSSKLLFTFPLKQDVYHVTAVQGFGGFQ